MVNQEVAATLLETLGLQVTTVDNGSEALEAVKENFSSESTSEPFAVILMDCHMPMMDGYTATREIRQLDFEKADSIPIIAVTANAMPGDRVRCIEAGMTDYLSKPIDKMQLIDVMTTALNGRSDNFPELKAA